MSTSTTNIWDGLEFKAVNSKSVFDYLKEQGDLLESATENELKLEIERTDAYLDETPITLVGVNTLYVVAPKLGNFRKKILIVIEGKSGSRFPVDIHCNIDGDKIEGVVEEDFLTKIKEILDRSLVRQSILNLYQQSKEYN